MHSQNEEEKIVLDYFNGEVGTLLSLGENDGITLSNSFALIKQGWSAVLVEPSPTAFAALKENHSKRKNVLCINAAISNYNSKANFFVSGTHLNIGDTSLLSSLNKNEIKKWKPTTEFTEVQVSVINVYHLLKLTHHKTFDFITSDTEGNDLIILRQMDLSKLGCRCYCIEWNGDNEVRNEVHSIMIKNKMSCRYISAENLIYTK